MISKYEEEVLKFFTQEENFKTMVHVSLHAKMVTEKIVLDFWQQLKNRLSERYKSTDLRVDFSDPFGVGHCKLWIYKDRWKIPGRWMLLAISFEFIQRGKDPFLGIFVGQDHKEYYDTIKINNYIKQVPKASDYIRDNSYVWYPIWKNIGKGFSNDLNLTEVLPGSKALEATLQNFFEEAVALVSDFEKEIDSIIDNPEYKYSKQI